MKYILPAVFGLIVLIASALVLFRAPIGAQVYERLSQRNIPFNVTETLDDGLHLILCGTGSPMPDPSRKGPCAAIIAGDDLFVFDAGSGAARNFGPMGLRIGDTRALFVTHFHSDHIDGLGEFLIQRWANSGASQPLDIYGPDGIEQIVSAFNQAYAFDRSYRVAHHGAEKMPPEGFGGVAHSFSMTGPDMKTVYSGNDIVISAFSVNHGSIEPAVGYRIDYKGRSIVISGDTAQSSALEAAAGGADILVHEALNEEMIDMMRAGFAKDGRDRLATIFDEVKSIHTSPRAAGESAERAGVKMLILTHIIPPAPSRYLSAFFAKDAKGTYSGDVIMGRDGMLFSLPADGSGIEKRLLLR